MLFQLFLLSILYSVKSFHWHVCGWKSSCLKSTSVEVDLDKIKSISNESDSELRAMLVLNEIYNTEKRCLKEKFDLQFQVAAQEAYYQSQLSHISQRWSIQHFFRRIGGKIRCDSQSQEVVMDFFNRASIESGQNFFSELGNDTCTMSTMNSILMDKTVQRHFWPLFNLSVPLPYFYPELVYGKLSDAIHSHHSMVYVSRDDSAMAQWFRDYHKEELAVYPKYVTEYDEKLAFVGMKRLEPRELQQAVDFSLEKSVH